TSVRYDTDAGCESAPQPPIACQYIQARISTATRLTLRRRRGANPCSMGDRRDWGLGRNQRPVSENCSEALTGSSWPIPLKNSLSVRLIWPLLALPMIMSWGFSALNDVIVG